MIERIQELIDKLNIQPSKFADEIGVPRSTISHLVSGRNKPSLDFIVKIVERYPEVNVDWIVFGRGNAFNDANMSSEIGYVEKMADKVDKNAEKPLKNQPDLFSIADQSDDISANIDTIKEIMPTESKESAENADNKKQTENNTNSQLSVENTEVEKIIILYKDKTFLEYSKR